MDDIRKPGKWLDNELSEQESADITRFIAIMPEIQKETDRDKILNQLAPCMNSFLHLLYLLIRGKLGLEATDDGIRYKEKPDLYFDIVAYTVDFITEKYDINELLTAAEVRTVLPQLSSIIPDKHLMPNNKLANSLTKEILNAGEFNLKVGDKSTGEIKTRCILSYEGDNIELTSRQPFTEYDRNVADAVTSLYEYGDESHIVTAATVYRAMVHATETETPSPQQIGAVTRSLDKMRFVRVQIDCSEELTKRKLSLNGAQVTGGKIDTYLLALEVIEVTAGGQKVKAYKVIKTPVLYDYSRLIGQVITVPAALLDVRDKTGAKVANTERRIAIKSYLLRRISVMKGKNGKKQSRNILFDTIYSEVSEEDLTEKEKRLIRDYIPQVLDYWKRQRFIKGYTELTRGKRKTGIEINI